MASVQLDLFDLLAEETAGWCWRCRHNVGSRCHCDLPIPYPPAEPLHAPGSGWCWCDQLTEDDLEPVRQWADDWCLANTPASP